MDRYNIGFMPPIQTPPKTPGTIVSAIQAEAKRQGVTAYRLAKDTGLRLHTCQRILAGDGSPTVATVEAVVKALGLVIDVRRTRRQSP